MSRFSVENLSGPPTDITRHRGLHLPKNRIGNAIYLSSTTTGRTSFIGYTCSFYFSLYFYFFLNSIGNIFQSKFYFDAKTASFGSTNTSTTYESCNSPSKSTSENLSELTGYVIHIHAA